MHYRGFWVAIRIARLAFIFVLFLCFACVGQNQHSSLPGSVFLCLPARGLPTLKGNPTECMTICHKIWMFCHIHRQCLRVWQTMFWEQFETQKSNNPLKLFSQIIFKFSKNSLFRERFSSLVMCWIPYEGEICITIIASVLTTEQVPSNAEQLPSTTEKIGQALPSTTEQLPSIYRALPSKY